MFYRTLVAGNVDFIWGGSRAALFEESEIRSVGDTTSASSGGYILQARVPNATDKGYVFLNSPPDARPRPWPGTRRRTGRRHLPGPQLRQRKRMGQHRLHQTARMDSHIAAVGWAGSGVNGQPAPNPSVSNATSGWRRIRQHRPARQSPQPGRPRRRLPAQRIRRRRRLRHPSPDLRRLQQRRRLEPITSSTSRARVTPWGQTPRCDTDATVDLAAGDCVPPRHRIRLP